MQEYTLGVDFKNKQIYGPTIELVQNDHNSTKLNFNFAETYDNFIKTIEIKYPSGAKLIDEIKDNAFIIKDILVESGEYQYEVVIYDETSKLTNFATGNLFVREQLVKDSDEEIKLESEYPILNQLIIDTKEALTQADNLNVNAEKVDGVTTLEITKKDGSTESVEIYDGTGGGIGGTSNYEKLEYLPSINDIKLIGNKSLEELGIQPKGEYLTSIPSEYISEDELNSKGFLTDESDPTVPNHVKSITKENINDWNNKSNFDGDYNNLTNQPFTQLTGTEDNPIILRNLITGIYILNGICIPYESSEKYMVANNAETHINAYEKTTNVQILCSSYNQIQYFEINDNDYTSNIVDLDDITTKEYVNNLVGDIETLLSEV